MENNILEALLSHNQDILAHEYMGVYERFLNKNLLLFALKHNNTDYMRKA
jgi:hypothetical protein